jgi:MFS family permease
VPVDDLPHPRDDVLSGLADRAVEDEQAASMVFNLGVPAPPFASRVLHLGGGGYGALMAAFGLGALPGALMAASARGEPDGRRLRVLTLLTGLAVILTAFRPVVLGAFLGLALSGFFSIWLIAAANTLVQLRAGPTLRGRVMASDRHLGRPGHQDQRERSPVRYILD